MNWLRRLAYQWVQSHGIDLLLNSKWHLLQWAEAAAEAAAEVGAAVEVVVPVARVILIRLEH